MDALIITDTMAINQRAVVEQTVTKERVRLFNFIKKRVADPDEAEDILQDVFFQLWRGYNTIESIEKITAWLFRVARNKITDAYRKKKPDNFSSIKGQNDREGDAPLLLAEMIPDRMNGPEDMYTRELLWDSIEEALEELPVKQRQVFVWHELEDRSFKEMSEQTGDTINTLLSRKRYAVQFLRKKLQELYNEI